MAEKDIVAALLERHGRLYSQDLHIDLRKNTPSPLFRWLCASILFSTRISAEAALSAAQALADAGWTTPQKMAAATWADRTRVLNRAGYARYDESTSRMLEDTARLLLEQHGGDLRALRDEAGRDPVEIRHRLKTFKGIGTVGAAIFCREAQVAWPELYPFADEKALDAAARLGLPSDAEALARLVPRDDFARLVAALVRTALAKDHDAVKSAAAED